MLIDSQMLKRYLKYSKLSKYSAEIFKIHKIGNSTKIIGKVPRILFGSEKSLIKNQFTPHKKFINIPMYFLNFLLNMSCCLFVLKVKHKKMPDFL